MIWKSLARVLKLSARAIVIAAPLAVVSPSVLAQSPMPIGLWQGATSGDFIMIQANGSCSARGTVNVAGRCEWLPTSAGGVLNLYYLMPLQPGRIGWSIIWVDRNTLMVNGVERFHRRG